MFCNVLVCLGAAMETGMGPKEAHKQWAPEEMKRRENKWLEYKEYVCCCSSIKMLFKPGENARRTAKCMVQIPPQIQYLLAMWKFAHGNYFYECCGQANGCVCLYTSAYYVCTKSIPAEKVYVPSKCMESYACKNMRMCGIFQVMNVW